MQNAAVDHIDRQQWTVRLDSVRVWPVMRKSLVWVLGLAEAWALAACGGGNGRTADAGASDAPPPSEDAAIDVAIDASLGITSPPPCGFTEALDASNDATTEATGLTIGTTDQSLCGTINTD